MAINKVVYGNDTLIDLTEDTATADDVLNGKTFHLKNGLRATGNASIGDGSLIIKENATTVETFNANQTTDTTLTLGNLAFYNGDTLASGVDPISIGIDMDLLWENASPTSSFSAQTISLDLSEYRLIFVVCKGDTGDTNYPTALAEFNTLTQIGTFNGYTRFRTFTATATGVQFGGGYKQTSYSNDSSDNSATIPYKIYGIK